MRRTNSGGRAGGSQRGSALVVSMLALAVIGTLSTAFVGSGVMDARHTERANGTVSAISIAESGVEIGVWEYRHGGATFPVADGWSGNGSVATPFRRTVAITDPGTATVAGEAVIQVVTVNHPLITLQATGFVPSQAAAMATRTVAVTVEPLPLFPKAIFANGKITLQQNAVVDSYDSALGPYHPVNNRGADASIGTNSIAAGDVRLLNNATLSGSAAVGPGGNPTQVITLSPGASISGGTSSQSSPSTYDSVTPPVGLPFRGNVVVPNNGTHTINSSGEYSGITLGNGATLVINNDAIVYVNGNLSIGNNGDVDILNNSAVSLVLNGAVNFGNNCSFNNISQDPSFLTLYCTANVATLDFSNNAAFYGTIYAPDTTVTVKNNSLIYGAVVAADILFRQNSILHYDVNLRKSAQAPKSGTVYVSKWQLR